MYTLLTSVSFGALAVSCVPCRLTKRFLLTFGDNSYAVWDPGISSPIRKNLPREILGGALWLDTQTACAMTSDVDLIVWDIFTSEIVLHVNIREWDKKRIDEKKDKIEREINKILAEIEVHDPADCLEPNKLIRMQREVYHLQRESEVFYSANGGERNLTLKGFWFLAPGAILFPCIFTGYQTNESYYGGTEAVGVIDLDTSFLLTPYGIMEHRSFDFECFDFTIVDGAGWPDHDMALTFEDGSGKTSLRDPFCPFKLEDEAGFYIGEGKKMEQFHACSIDQSGAVILVAEKCIYRVLQGKNLSELVFCLDNTPEHAIVSGSGKLIIVKYNDSPPDIISIDKCCNSRSLPGLENVGIWKGVGSNDFLIADSEDPFTINHIEFK